MITQCKFSDSVKFFENDFLNRWQLEQYHDVNKPAVFVGIYSTNDISNIIKHKTECIVIPCGADFPRIGAVKHLKNVTFLSTNSETSRYFHQLGIKFIQKNIPFKSFEQFKPTPKGDKVYVYINNSSGNAQLKYKIDQLQSTIDYFGKDLFIFGTQGNSIEYCIENFYAKSFINIQLNPFGGFTSALEMAHMGRKSISNNKTSFCINYSSNVDIITAIQTEMANKTLDNSVFNYLDNSNDWLKIWTT